MKPRLTLEITDLAYGGDGVGRYEGKVIFVPYTLPGETVRVEIVEEKKQFARGKCVEIVKPSVDRVTPRCRHYGECGGCQLQHVAYEKQLAFKFNWVKKLLEPLQAPAIHWLTPIGMEDPWGYRRRIQVHRNVNGEWGFHRLHTHEVIPIEECPITDHGLMQQFSQLTSQLPQAITRAELPDPVEKKYFTQVNSQQNAKLVSSVMHFAEEVAREEHDREVWDLFAGDGNYSLPLSTLFKKVIHVEVNAEAVRRAQETATGRIIFETGLVEEVWRKKLAKQPTPNLIVLNPPRQGAKKLMAYLGEMQKPAPALIYVSCEPPTLARDLKQLIKAGYVLHQVQVIDLFPQTFHIETVVMLRPGV